MTIPPNALVEFYTGRAPDFRGRMIDDVWRMSLDELDGARAGIGPNAVQRQAVWLTRGNHNFLRLTRIMKSLATLSLPDLAAGWLEALRGIYSANPNVIGADTWRYWQAAPTL